MATPFIRFVLFVSSYWPALLILAIRYWGSDPSLAVELGVLASLLFVFAGACFVSLRGGRVDDLTIITADCQREVFSSYLLGYLLPVILVDLRDSSAVTAVLVFLLMLGLVVVRSNFIYANPILGLMGYRVYHVTGNLRTAPAETVAMVLLVRKSVLSERDVIAVRGSDPAFRFGG